MVRVAAGERGRGRTARETHVGIRVVTRLELKGEGVPCLGLEERMRAKSGTGRERGERGNL